MIQPENKIMKGAQQYLEDHKWDNVEVGGNVESNTQKGKYYFAYKSLSDGFWYCNCTAGLMNKECRHKRIMAEKFGEGDKCFYCGTTRWAAGGLDRNHVKMRSLSPELADESSNIMLLCRRDHDRFHSDSEFRNNLIKIWERKMKTKIEEITAMD